MTDADIDRIAERVADKLWQRWEQQAVERFVDAFMSHPLKPTHDCFPQAPAETILPPAFPGYSSGNQWW